ncbi:MAG: phytanoyl-CoA dioxygenase family protein [Pseudomonadota bacterium]|nr:phytanoyl-CoA dioxygenase family protein [Pseudomonadota bacterium]
MSYISRKQILDFQRNGAVMIPGLFSSWVETIKKGINFNIKNPSQYAAENTKNGENGRFFDDYCNWQRIPEFEEIIKKSEASKAAAELMGSKKVQFFHDHVLYKSAGSETTTPWHQDAPYYFTQGDMTVSFWIPVDPITSSSLRVIAGSHKWKKEVLPTKWLTGDDFYNEGSNYIPAPDPDKETDRYEILEWDMLPGDAIAFHFNVVHGARGNKTKSKRRVLSLRYVGDDVRYTDRPGRTSPPFPGHNMTQGQRLREDWFPYL